MVRCRRRVFATARALIVTLALVAAAAAEFAFVFDRAGPALHERS
jgi:hypothetical protein